MPAYASTTEALDVVLDAVAARQPARIRADWLVEDLEPVLAGIVRAPGAPLEERLAALERAVQWLRARRSGLGGGAPGLLSAARLRLLLDALRELPEHGLALRAVVQSVLRETRALTLLAEVGLPSLRMGVSDRLLDKCLPRAADARELSHLVARLFPRETDAGWFEELGPELAAQAAEALGLGGPQGLLDEAMTDALALLAARTSAAGLSADIRERAPKVDLANDPFLRLPRACDTFTSAVRAGRAAAAGPAFRAAITHCRWSLRRVQEDLEHAGISMDLLFRLEALARVLDRMTSIVAVLAPEPESTATAGALQLASELVRGRAADTSVRSAFNGSVRQLACRVIERVGHTGEHYITVTRAGWHRMVSSAAGGGLITAGTVAMKFWIHLAALPIFFEALFSSANYAASFLLMHLLGFTLATKQPAMTGAALAKSMRAAGADPRRPIDVEPLVDLVARILRSQLAAIIGNVGLVVPAALLLDVAYRLVTGHAVLEAPEARHVLESLHPTRSATVFYAAFTGFLLWMGSLGAGWLENFVAFRRLPEAIATSPRLCRLVGAEQAERAGALLEEHASSIGGSVALGVLLGSAPALGKIFGAPLEVRHVTLQTGALTLAAASLGSIHAVEAGLLAATVGIATVAVLNVGVSFGLALTVALKAREATSRDHRSFLRALCSRLWHAPGSFLLPPRR